MPGIPSKPNNIPLASSLPKVSFRKVPPEEALLFHIPPGIIDPHAFPFGYNDGSEYDKPDHYIRYVEPVEGDLKKQVEYDMDEQDQAWLDALNFERRKDGLDTISYETFEIILDQLEKEWFDLMKRVPPKARPGAGADHAGADDDDADSDGGEDSRCAICDDGECENSNAIVFCDGCNLAVHQDCYGIPYIPEGQWLCRKCTVSPDRAVSCILCPHEGGAFKQTTTGKWAHLLCAMWIPETGVSNPVYMEPIDSVERIPKARWKLQCYLCRYRMGACIQCDNRSCFTAFHVTCARKAGLLFRTERTRVSHHLYDDSDDSDNEDSEVLRASCHRHMPLDMRDQLKIDFSRQGAVDDDRSEMSYRASPMVSSRTREQSVESGFGAPLISISRRSSIIGGQDETNTNNGARSTSKSARAYKKSFKAGPPIIPAYIANRVLEYITKIHLRKKTTAVQLIARYWSLKREARRGAPLLKRLHLEPWTASSQNKEQTEAQKAKKLHFLRSIREDLERVRMLVEQVRKREKEKLRQAQEIRNSLVEPVFFPFHADIRAAIAKFEAVDKHGFFAQPVSKVDVPDYYDIVKEPMDWTAIKDKIATKTYESVDEVRQDVLKIATNAMTYNKADTPYHKAATKILKMIPDVFNQLAAVETSHLREHQQKLQEQQQDREQTQEGDEGAQEPAAGRELDAETVRELRELGLEPPSLLLSLLQDYRTMDEAEQLDIRQQAYGSHPLPPSVHVKAEDDAGDEPAAEEQANKRGEIATPIINLMEDFAQQVYVPAPPPLDVPASPPPSENQPGSSKAAAMAKPKTPAPKAPRKRKASDSTPREPVERRSTRRSIAIETSTAHLPEPAPAPAPETTEVAGRNKRRRAHTSAAAIGSPLPDASEDAETRSSTPMAKSRSQPATSNDGVQLKDDVGAHDSFLLFNTGWVLPEGSKRHRNGAARPEMIGQRPRKISAPESPRAEPLAAAAAAVRGTPQRPRSETESASSQANRTRAGSAVKAQKQEERRGSGSGRKTKRHEREADSVGSSPLTSDDEAEAEGNQDSGTHELQRRSKRTRETSAVSETASSSGSTSRSLRLRTRSHTPTPNATAARLRALTQAGTNVWAKIDTFPHFPAVVVTDPNLIPKEVLKLRPETDGIVAVMFYGRPRSWGWVAASKLAPLLVDEVEDEKYLKLGVKKGKGKPVRDAYEEAKAKAKNKA